jgi:hypothetical protein
MGFPLGWIYLIWLMSLHTLDLQIDLSEPGRKTLLRGTNSRP